MADLVAAATGYETVADFNEAGIQLDGSAPSKSGVVSPSSLVSFIWPAFDLYPGRFIETGTGSKEMWGIVGE
jgi:hypothetical protein